MGSIQGNREAGQKLVESGGLRRVDEASSTPNAPSISTSSYPPAPNPELRCPLPPLSVQQPDMQRQWQSSAVPQARISPLPPASNANTGAQAASQTNIVVQSGGGGLKVQTNSHTVNTPLGLINFADTTGVAWSADAQGNISATASGGGASDGLIHGTGNIWETDPAYVSMRDDFLFSGNASSSNIGELAWATANITGTGTSYYAGGLGFPYAGWYAVGTNSTSANVGLVMYPTQGASGAINSLQQPDVWFWPLLDFPGWKATFIFMLGLPNPSDQASGGTAAFNTTKLSMYIGLGKSFAIGDGGRPPVFFGVRYDTDPTAPSIGDSTFVLEAVMNPPQTSYSRNNIQGTNGGTFNTGVSPQFNVAHRVDISCSAAGKVTVTLDGVGSTFTLTQPAYTYSSGFSVDVGGGIAGLPGPPVPLSTTNGWNTTPPGGIINVTGLAGGFAPYNGNHTVIANSQQGSGPCVYIADVGGSAGAVSYTLGGYPGLVPIVSFCNDSQGSAPASGTRNVLVDFFSFVWNPALASGGTPVSTKARYW